MGGAGAAHRGVPSTRTRRSITTCVALSRRSSGGTTAARSGGRSRPRWGPGGWRRRPSAAGRGWAPGSGCWIRRSSGAGSRPGWLSSTAPASGRTTRPRARQKRGIFSGARRARGARPVARRLRDQGVRGRRCLRPRHRFRPRPRTSTRAAAGTAAPDTPLDHPRLDRGRPRIRQSRLPRPHLAAWRTSRDPGQAHRSARRVPAVDLPQPQSGRVSLGAAQRVARRRHPLQRKPRVPSWACSAWPPRWTGSSSQRQNSGTDRP